MEPYASPELWPAAPPPGPKKSRTPLIVAGLVAVLLAVGGLVTFLLLRNSGPLTPSEAVQAYLEGHRDGDVEQIDQVYCQKYDAAKSLSEYQEEKITKIEWKILGEEINGAKAKVNAELSVTKEGETETNTGKLDLVDEDGWKVCENP